MNLKSIRWRLPLTYAGVATLTVLVLGGTLLAILQSYYQAQELNYLKKNAMAISSGVAPFLVASADPPAYAPDLKTHLALLSFLSQTRVRLLDSQGNELGSFSFIGEKNSQVIVSAVSLPQIPEGATQAPTGDLKYRVATGALSGPWTAPAGDSSRDVLGVQIYQPADRAIPDVNPNTGEKIRIWSIPAADVAGGKNITQPGTVSTKTLVSLFPAAGTMFGFDLQGDGPLSSTRSSQIYLQRIYSESGVALGSVELSDGPAYGQDILMGVARGWIVAGVVAILVAGLAGWWISRRMSAPLLELSAVTTRMARGDLSARAATGAQDEFGLLARSYNEMADRMEETVCALRRFASDAAHELHTPLTALHTNLELAAADQARNGGANPALEQAWEQMKRLETLTRDLLDLSRIEAHSPARCESVDLASLVSQACEPYASAAEQNGIEFSLDLPGEGTTVSAQPAHLTRAFENLLNNAVKFTAPGGTIRVKVWKEAAEVVLSVEDNGIGIPEEDLPFMFSRFHRARNATGYPGSGLGLAIAKAIVEQHAGSIRVSSTNPGTRFEVRLPAVAG